MAYISVNLDKNINKIPLSKIQKTQIYEKLNTIDLISIDDNTIQDIKNHAKLVRDNIEVFVIIGTGGSILGAKAGIQVLSEYFDDSNIEVIYTGYNISTKFLTGLLNYIQGKKVHFNVVSKSGNTIETNTTYNFFKEEYDKSYSQSELSELFTITTANKSGYLYNEAKQKGYKTFDLPEDIPGRFGFFTATVLFPLSVMNFDINKVIDGAKKSLEENHDINNPAYQYALFRYTLLNLDYQIELIACTEEKHSSFLDWIIQLFCESEGKNNNGLFVSKSLFPSDFHSLGQYLQDGSDNVFETVLSVRKEENSEIDEVRDTIIKQSLKEHQKRLPCSNIVIGSDNEFTIGYLAHCLMFSCIISATLLKVNPFDQPQVESYKDKVNIKY